MRPLNPVPLLLGYLFFASGITTAIGSIQYVYALHILDSFLSVDFARCTTVSEIVKDQPVD